MKTVPTIGIVGGTGQLGSAIALGLLRNKYFRSEQLWISIRSSNTSVFKKGFRIKFTTHNQDLVDSCQVVILSVPPHLVPAIDIDAEDRLVISVMAGVSIKQLQQNTNTKRVVRAISNPAAKIGLEYSPWCATTDLVDRDREWTQKIFEACGLTDEVSDENQINHFTAITGPAPGFVA